LARGASPPLRRCADSHAGSHGNGPALVNAAHRTRSRWAPPAASPRLAEHRSPPPNDVVGSVRLEFRMPGREPGKLKQTRGPHPSIRQGSAPLRRLRADRERPSVHAASAKTPVLEWDTSGALSRPRADAPGDEGTGDGEAAGPDRATRAAPSFPGGPARERPGGPGVRQIPVHARGGHGPRCSWSAPPPAPAPVRRQGATAWRVCSSARPASTALSARGQRGGDTEPELTTAQRAIRKRPVTGGVAFVGQAYTTAFPRALW